MTTATTCQTTAAAGMPGSGTLPAAAPSRRRVTDAFTRAQHALMALSFAGAYLTAESEHWRLLHVVLGYTLAGLLLVRMLDGVWGPRRVALSALFGRLRSAPVVLKGLRASLHGAVFPWRMAQNLLVVGSVVAIMLSIPPLTLTGVIAFHEWGFDALEEWHETLGEGLLVAVGIHLLAVLGLSVWRRENLASPMLSGTVSGRGPDLVQNTRWVWAFVLVLVVVGYWAWVHLQSANGLW
jgi:cytochrome b